MKTPVAFFIFRRPSTTERVFEAIRQAKPPKLLVVADGPRPDKPGEAEQCAAARAVIDRVDWDCEVLTNYSEVNLGCRNRVASGIDWVFQTVEEAIILEDDCLPDASFFPYCEELLDRYRDDKRVMMITGTNILGDWKSAQQSYHFAYYTSCWGWASWRRAWNYYDVDMQRWTDPEIQQRIQDVLVSEKHYQNFKLHFDYVISGANKAWDFQWSFACLSQSGLTITPATNLVSNIGYTGEATHTTESDNGLADRPVKALPFPLKHPWSVSVDRDYDEAYYQKVHGPGPLSKRIVRKVKKILTPH